MIFAVYVDDIISVSNEIDMLSKEKVLLYQRFHMIDKGGKPISTPFEPGKHALKLSEDDKAFDKSIHQHVIGCLTYLLTVTRPDIAVVVRILSRFMAS